ncbi:hemerythrin domain-containing protein [Streptomyces sp. NPDC057011]|uniref:hemerythrin domain-containing protein n=1 Tax=unclassified Streptomyces TaxID=2593676 RepID=UPI00363FBF0E
MDMTAMFAMHDVLRRELRHLARIAARADPDPRHVLLGSAGWETFKGALRAHHSAEDDALWPALRQALGGRPYDLTRLVAMEAEHAAIASLVGAIDEALADPRAGPDLFGVLTGSLVTGLGGHLDHEEEAVFPLARAVLGVEEWGHFERLHAERTAPYANGVRRDQWEAAR